MVILLFIWEYLLQVFINDTSGIQVLIQQVFFFKTDFKKSSPNIFFNSHKYSTWL